MMHERSLIPYPVDSHLHLTQGIRGLVEHGILVMQDMAAFSI